MDRRAAKHLGRVESEHPIHQNSALAESLRASSAGLDAHRRRDATSEGKDALKQFDKYRGDTLVTGVLRSHAGKAPTAVSDLRATEDLVCPNPAEVSRRWQHSPKRNYSLVPQATTRMCVTEVTRMSRRLLSAVAAFARRREAGMFCEMRAPTVCQRLSCAPSARSSMRRTRNSSLPTRPSGCAHGACRRLVSARSRTTLLQAERERITTSSTMRTSGHNGASMRHPLMGSIYSMTTSWEETPPKGKAFTDY